MEKCPASLIIRKCKSKQWDITLYPVGWPLSKEQKISAAEDAEKLEPCTLSVGKMVQSLWKIVKVFLKKFKIEVPHDPETPLQNNSK
jgi:hypothetical protein